LSTRFTIKLHYDFIGIISIQEVRDDENTWNTKTEQITITTAGRTEYYLTDHLGSIRTTIDGNTGAVLGYDDYYPFGLAMPGRSSNTGTPNDLNKFTGHERDIELSKRCVLQIKFNSINVVA
jgi:hypothetical protein